MDPPGRTAHYRAVCHVIITFFKFSDARAQPSATFSTCEIIHLVRCKNTHNFEQPIFASSLKVSRIFSVGICVLRCGSMARGNTHASFLNILHQVIKR